MMGVHEMNSNIIISIVAQTLSQQGNFVPIPLRSIQHRVDDLKDCAKICMQSKLCDMFIYNVKSRSCKITSGLHKATRMAVGGNELAYKRGEECEPSRRMLLRTNKLLSVVGKKEKIRAFVPPNTPVYPIKQNLHIEHPLPFCHAINNIPDCELSSFGSADGGRRLTLNDKLKNYVHYGYCSKKQKSCNANTAVYEYRTGSNFEYVEQGTKTTKGILFCYFWNNDNYQCTPLPSRAVFDYNFPMEYEKN